MLQKAGLIDQDIILTEWDHTSVRLDPALEGRIIQQRDRESYIVSLAHPIEFDGQDRERLAISARHVGHPLENIFPGAVRRVLMFRHPLWRLFIPVVAVNVTTDSGEFFAVASVYLKSVYVKIRELQARHGEDSPPSKS